MKNSIIAAAAVLVLTLPTFAQNQKPAATPTSPQKYDYPETRNLVQLVDAAADLVAQKGDDAFADFRKPGSRWRHGETYIFVLDTNGNMLVHPDPALEGKNELQLKDIKGKPIIRGLIDTATLSPNKPQGWYHYQWPVPGELFPRWKSTYVRLVKTQNGPAYIVGSGMYDDRMERSFVVDLVQHAANEIAKNSVAAYEKFHDPKDEFIVKDTYIFVLSPQGTEIVNPGFPNLEGRNVLNYKDTAGKQLNREMIETVERNGSGWVDYMFPKPGESVPTRKSAHVTKAKVDDHWVVVGCGVYLEHAPKAAAPLTKMTAPQLISLVRDASAMLQQKGEAAFPDLRKKGSKWFNNQTYFFIRDMNQNIIFHAADPSQEGRNMSRVTDIHGRPYGRMFKEAATSPSGEGWVHYQYPEPGNIFPMWKSTFVKRTTFPNGKDYIVGCGIYDMQMDDSFVTDAVNRAAALIAQHGKDAFPEIRDKKGPFVFMDNYVFVDDMNGTELVCGGHPELENRNLIDLKDVNGKYVMRACLNAVANKDTGWVDYMWYKPGENAPARKRSFIRKVTSPDGTYIVGAGYFPTGNAVAKEAAGAGTK